MGAWTFPAAASLCMALAACAGEPPSLADLTSPKTVDATKGDGGEAKGGFNPFTAAPDVVPGGRDVIAKPTLAEVLAKGPLPEFSIGRADAPVTMIKYASLTCPYCRQFHLTVFPELKRSYIDTGKVRFIIREFPIGQSSGNATIALRCAKSDKYLELYGKFLAQQASWVEQEVRVGQIFAVAQQVGMTRVEFDGCLKNQGMIGNLNWVKERGRKLGVIGTPNFFIQEKLFKKQLTMSEIRAAVDPLLPKTATDALAAGQ